MWLDTLENIVQIWQQIIPCCNNNGSLESYMHGSVVIREYRRLTHLRKKVWFLKTLPQSLMRNKRLCIPRGSCDSTQKFWVQPFFAWRKLYIQKILMFAFKAYSNQKVQYIKIICGCCERELVCIASITTGLIVKTKAERSYKVGGKVPLKSKIIQFETFIITHLCLKPLGLP